MRKRGIQNVKLGVFVLAGLLFLIILLYMIGRSETMFVKRFKLKAHFENVQGLVEGNNVRFSGIEVGTVSEVRFLSDTVIEVVMIIEQRMKQFIKRNAEVSIGTDGLMGNRLVNISPGKGDAPLVEEGDILPTLKLTGIDQMLQTLEVSNQNIVDITGQLKLTAHRINSASGFWTLMEDPSLPIQIRNAAGNLQQATARAQTFIDDLNALTEGVKRGEGSVGILLKDTAFAVQLRDAVHQIQQAGDRADSLLLNLNQMTSGLRNDVESGNGIVQTLIRDSTLSNNLRESLENIQKGTDAFNQNMEALKRNFLFRGYFRKLEKQKGN